MTTTKVYLVRHAHADWQPDEARPLSESGRKAAKTVAALLSALPISAIYSSPARRSVETVEQLADRLGLHTQLVPDLREREMPVVPAADFERVVMVSWSDPASAMAGGESSAGAQARGLNAIRRFVTQRVGEHLVLATHGNLLALILNGFDASFGYEFWRQQSFPDIYELEFEGTALIRVQRIWKQAA